MVILNIFFKLLFISLALAVSQQLLADGLPAEFNYKKQNNTFWEQHLSPPVYAICRQQKTEPPGSGAYDNFYEDGIYYCACCGGDHAVFSSNTKFDSGTGWPSFYAPLANGVIEQPDKTDYVRNLFDAARTEVVCERCLSHLGHVFDDGPEPTGKRYCMNSLALVFFRVGEKPIRTFVVE